MGPLVDHGAERDAFYAGLASELEKVAKESNDESWLRRNRYLAAGLGGAALGAGALLMAKPNLRSNILHSAGALLRGKSPRAAERSRNIPAAAMDNAKRLADALADQGIDFKTARIAISGPGGSGKSTIAEALKQHTGMGVIHVEETGKLMGRHGTTGEVSKGFFVPKGHIAEQTHLTSAVDPNKFDAIVHLGTNPDQIKEQLIRRGRGGWQWSLYDYRLKAKAIENSFNMNSGKTHHAAPGIKFKVKPTGGFQSDEILDRALRARGINPEGLNRQAKVIASAAGSRTTLPGILPYLKKRTAAEFAVASGAGAGTGIGVTHALTPKRRASSEK